MGVLKPVPALQLDCAAFPTRCADLEVSGYPSLILFKQGRQVRRQTLAQHSTRLRKGLTCICPSCPPHSSRGLLGVGKRM